jgi:hypothetical protein
MNWPSNDRLPANRALQCVIAGLDPYDQRKAAASAAYAATDQALKNSPALLRCETMALARGGHWP